jgi:putative tryptophan/tyrosine transport system substrate-binding protein
MWTNIEGAEADIEFIVVDNDEAIYRSLLNDIREGVKSRHIENVRFIDSSTLIQRFNENKPRACTLIIPVGTGSTKTLIENRFDIPILSVAVPRANYLSLLKSVHPVGAGKNDSRFGAIFLDQPISRRVVLLHEILPNAENISVLLGPSTVDMKDEIKRVLEHYDYKVKVGYFDGGRNIVGVLDDLLEVSDAMLGIADPAVFNAENAKNILLTAYRWRVPLFGLSPAYVRAGSLAAVYTSPVQFATQVVDFIESTDSCEQLSRIQPQYPKYFDVKVNYKLAEAIGIVIDSQERLRANIAGLGEGAQ